MNIDDLRGAYEVRALDDGDIPSILALCLGNPRFYEHFPPGPTPETILRDMRLLPPGKAPEDKHYIGWFDGESLVAALDLVMGYPDPATAYIGFFMVDRARQGRGVGSRLIEELCAALRRWGFTAARLCWADGNPQAEGFWRKNGFAETGLTAEREACTVVVAQREL